MSTIIYMASKAVTNEQLAIAITDWRGILVILLIGCVGLALGSIVTFLFFGYQPLDEFIDVVDDFTLLCGRRVICYTDKRDKGYRDRKSPNLIFLLQKEPDKDTYLILEGWTLCGSTIALTLDTDQKTGFVLGRDQYWRPAFPTTSEKVVEIADRRKELLLSMKRNRFNS